MTKIKFENTPSTKTPINAENLNKLNNVVINSTEPTTGEEVWIQKGKNLFDGLLELGAITATGTLDTSTTRIRSVNFIKVNPNTTYTIKVNKYTSSKGTPRLNIISYSNNNVGSFISSTGWNDNTYTFTTKSDCKYIKLLFFLNGSSSQTLVTSDISSVQLEQGSTATEYEPYIDKKIYTKNDNGVYEEFYNEAEHNKEIYSENEIRIGTWIDGKPLYRKVIIGTIGSSLGNYETNIYNLHIDERGKFEAYIYDSNNSKHLIGYYNGTTYIRAYYVKDRAGISIGGNMGNFSNQKYELILEYTKTTD
jgi:hypothetical protein